MVCPSHGKVRMFQIHLNQLTTYFDPIQVIYGTAGKPGYTGPKASQQLPCYVLDAALDYLYVVKYRVNMVNVESLATQVNLERQENLVILQLIDQKNKACQDDLAKWC